MRLHNVELRHKVTSNWYFRYGGLTSTVSLNNNPLNRPNCLPNLKDGQIYVDTSMDLIFLRTVTFQIEHCYNLVKTLERNLCYQPAKTSKSSDNKECWNLGLCYVSQAATLQCQTPEKEKHLVTGWAKKSTTRCKKKWQPRTFWPNLS